MTAATQVETNAHHIFLHFLLLYLSWFFFSILIVIISFPFLFTANLLGCLFQINEDILNSRLKWFVFVCLSVCDNVCVFRNVCNFNGISILLNYVFFIQKFIPLNNQMIVKKNEDFRVKTLFE